MRRHKRNGAAEAAPLPWLEAGRLAYQYGSTP